MYHGGGQVVSVIAFYSDDPSSKPTEVSTFWKKEAGICLFFFKKTNKHISLEFPIKITLFNMFLKNAVESLIFRRQQWPLIGRKTT